MDRNRPTSLNQVYPAGSFDQIDSQQASFMLGSQYVETISIPEPPSPALALFGGFALAAAVSRSLWQHFRA